ncbi:NADP-dependent oxidoreductase [Streptomyces sp. ME02-8801-2C]|uniref:NADP-dependent oxidoreductase n=1 Tax=Streptomyces sp. ME02-8801-2C TaxID=3028680 RepID=UPI0029A6C19E|nr:NADP-dependent oxidoreductase [Streptomyces sp. ME02-8801-2C]MDX3452738.1 NADP-dependent oxidoreductase [Streptomyces sp. ME02-8801-2C]
MTPVTPPRTTRVVCLVRRPVGEPLPTDFAVEECPLPSLEEGQLLVRNLYMSVDPSMRGRLESTEKHYTHNFTPGSPLDGRALGVVEESRSEAVPPGTYVRHQLGWRERAVVDAADTDGAGRIDPALAPLPTWLGLLGQTGFTAYVGLTRIARLRPGDTVLVSAAAGAVGTAAGQFARLLGADRVVGTAGGPDKCALLVKEFGYDAAADYRAEPVRDALARLAPDGIDVYFDNVGGEQLAAALHALRTGGRVALCGMMSQFGGNHENHENQRSADINQLIQAVLKRLTLRGFIVRDHDDLRAEFERRVAGWLTEGRITARETVVDGLENAPGALLSLLGGGNVGKMLVRLGD